MASKLQDLTSQYLYWEAKKEKAQERLDRLKKEIVILAEEKKINDLDERAELYSQALEQANFNPENIHLILGVEDPLEDLVLTKA